MKLTPEEIIKLLDNLIGPTEPYGDNMIDLARRDNLRILLEITDWCLDGIYFSLKGINSSQSSSRIIGNMAKSAFEDYNKWIKEKLDEYSIG
jgi:hypothetical protein